MCGQTQGLGMSVTARGMGSCLCVSDPTIPELSQGWRSHLQVQGTGDQRGRGWLGHGWSLGSLRLLSLGLALLLWVLYLAL